MKVQFLGTSAAPSVPIPFCHCKVCLAANKHRGRNLRKRSSVKINEDIIIDIGPDIMSSSFEHNIILSDISVCLQTHSHEDHFDPEMIISRHKEYGTIIKNNLNLTGSLQTLKKMDSIIGKRCDYCSIFEEKTQSELNIKLLPVEPYKKYSLKDYTIIGYPANHGIIQDGSLLYSIEYNSKCLFYGTDTSIIFEEVWEQLCKSGKKFDLIILDHTYGFEYESRTSDHLALKDFIKHVQRFKDRGLLKNEGKIYATHLSHEGIIEHAEFNKYAKENGYNIAYDGLTINL